VRVDRPSSALFLSAPPPFSEDLYRRSARLMQVFSHPSLHVNATIRRRLGMVVSCLLFPPLPSISHPLLGATPHNAIKVPTRPRVDTSLSRSFLRVFHPPRGSNTLSEPLTSVIPKETRLVPLSYPSTEPTTALFLSFNPPFSPYLGLGPSGIF